VPGVTGAYATWAAWLGSFGRGEVHEADGLPAMRGEELGARASQLFAQRCADAFDARLGLWAKRLQRDLGHARTEADMARALVAARSALAPIRRFTESPLLMEEIRTALADALRTAITDLQAELERQAQRSGYREREATLRTLRGAPLTRALEGDGAPPAEAPAQQLSGFDPLAPAGPRRILMSPGAQNIG
jgi:hypothetical protein